MPFLTSDWRSRRLCSPTVSSFPVTAVLLFPFWTSSYFFLTFSFLTNSFRDLPCRCFGNPVGAVDGFLPAPSFTEPWSWNRFTLLALPPICKFFHPLSTFRVFWSGFRSVNLHKCFTWCLTEHFLHPFMSSTQRWFGGTLFLFPSMKDGLAVSSLFTSDCVCY